MVEYLGLADYLLIAEAVLGVRAEVLYHSTDLNLADSALHAPAASYGGFATHSRSSDDVLEGCSVSPAGGVAIVALPWPPT